MQVLSGHQELKIHKLLALSISKTSLQDCILVNKEVNKTSGYFYDVLNTLWFFLICEYWHYPELIQFPCLVCAGSAVLKIEEKFCYQRALIFSNKISVSPDLSIQRM